MQKKQFEHSTWKETLSIYNITKFSYGNIVYKSLKFDVPFKLEHVF